MVNLSCFPQVQNYYVDQWRSHIGRQPETSCEAANNSGTELGITSGDEAASGVRARRRMASLLVNKIRKKRYSYK